MVESKGWFAIVWCGLLTLMQGCGTPGPQPSKGTVDVVLRGDPTTLCNFAKAAGNACGATVPPECQASPPKLEELSYHCSLNEKGVGEMVASFGQHYVDVLTGTSRAGERHMDAGGQASGNTPPFEMMMTTGATCKQMSCGGGPLLLWVPWPYALPCTQRCAP